MCGKTESDSGFFRMPCSEASISQIAASAEDDKALQLEQHIICGTCAEASVGKHSLQCGICNDPCIPSPAAWGTKRAKIASDIETARSMSTAAWAAVSQAAALGDPRTVGDDVHVVAVNALIGSANTAYDFIQELASADPPRIPPDNASSTEVWDKTMEELDAARDAAAVVAGRYARRAMSKRDNQLDAAIDQATEAGLLPDLTCSLSEEGECEACSVVPFGEGNRRGAVLQCRVCAEALCVPCALEAGGQCNNGCGHLHEVPLPPRVAQALTVYNAAAGPWDQWAQKYPAASEDEDDELDLRRGGWTLDEGPDGDWEDNPINEYWPGTKLWKESLKEMLQGSSSHAPPAPPDRPARGSYAAVALRHAEEEEEQEQEQVEDPHDTYRAAAAAAAVQALPLLARLTLKP